MDEDDMPLSMAMGRRILGELEELRRDMAAALAGIRAAVDELHRIAATETIIESELEGVAGRLVRSPSDRVCESCGSQLERHVAENGLLLICKACGRSSFLDRRDGQERRRLAATQPLEGAPTAVPDPSDGWTGK